VYQQPSHSKPRPELPNLPPPKKSRAWLWIILGVVGVLVCSCIGLIAIAASHQNASSTDNQIGYAIDALPWSVLVSSAKETQQGNFAPSQGTTYLIFTIELTNTSSDVQHTSSLLQWTLDGSNNVEYAESIGANVQTPEGTVAPGASVNGQIAYEVPLDLHQFTLTFEPNPGSDTLVTWDITV